LAVVAAGGFACARAEERVAAGPQTVTVAVRLPITGTRDTEVEAAILRQIDRLRGRPGERGVLVLQFTADDADGPLASDFGRSLELARFLSDGRLDGVKTVAFIPEDVKGHAVLVALGCEEIVMAPEAVLGPANADEPDVDEAMRAAYAQIAARRKTLPPALALALLDPAAKVVRVSTDDGEQYIEEKDLAELKKNRAVLDVEEMAPLPLAVTGRRGRELGIVRLLARTPADLARGLGVAERALQADLSIEGGWKATQIVLNGPITADAVARARSRMDEAIAGGSNFLCLRIDSPGGEPEQSLVLASWLARLDPARVRTVAYVPSSARADAALVALACDELVMAPTAVLGGEGAATIDERQADAIAVAWREGVAKKRGRSWSLPVALLKPGMIVHRAVQEATGRVEYFSDEELLSREDRDG